MAPSIMIKQEIKPSIRIISLEYQVKCKNQLLIKADVTQLCIGQQNEILSYMLVTIWQTSESFNSEEDWPRH